MKKTSDKEVVRRRCVHLICHPVTLVFHRRVFPPSMTLHQHHHNSLLSLSTSFSVFLYPSPLLSPPLPHAYTPTPGMPESVEVLIRVAGVPGLLRPQIIYREKVKPCFQEAPWNRISYSLWTFANIGEDRDAPTL